MQVMKLNAFDAHDRLQHLIKTQSETISKGAEDCLKKNPDSLIMQKYSPYIYIFAHPRKHENGKDTRLIWQPRMSMPKAQTNSYLFRVQTGSDAFQICWQIPPREQWQSYRMGNVTENKTVLWSIAQFENNREALERPHPDDRPDHIQEIAYQKFVAEVTEEILMKKNYPDIMLPT